MVPRFQLHPDSASSFSGEVDALYWFLVGLTAFFSLLIAVLVAVFAIKYRRRHPAEVGWRNPSHVIASALVEPHAVPEVVVTSAVDGTVALLCDAPAADAAGIEPVTLRAGDHYPVRAVFSGSQDSTETSAEGYHV